MKKKKLLAYLDRRIEIYQYAKAKTREELDYRYNNWADDILPIGWAQGVEEKARALENVQQKISLLYDIREDIVFGAHKGEE